MSQRLTKYKRPESVLVVVYTTTGQFLLLRRSQPNCYWQSVTGSLEWGESPVNAARRELYEETGLCAGASLINLQHSVTFRITAPWKTRYASHMLTNREHWFGLRLANRRLIRINPSEHSEYQWTDLNQACRLAQSQTNIAAMKRLAVL